MSDNARNFWLERWDVGQIGFHQSDVNSRLQRFWPQTGVAPGGSVFVPLCGKTLDMHFLAACGHRVIGVEFSEIAVRAFFEEADIAYERNDEGSLPCFEGGAFRLYCGDFFALNRSDIGDVAAVYDRASLIALPPDTRPGYAQHLADLATSASAMLVLTILYDQNAVAGPPFSVPTDELRELYAADWEVETLEVDETPTMPPKFEGLKASEIVHRLRPIG
ncbi:MAG: thiopurine S-methyltransferase [Myxococcota bacterium]|nr:thiopurine S-methyltransferase [Myxococcota bacterium]